MLGIGINYCPRYIVLYFTKQTKHNRDVQVQRNDLDTFEIVDWKSSLDLESKVKILNSMYFDQLYLQTYLAISRYV